MAYIKQDLFYTKWSVNVKKKRDSFSKIGNHILGIKIAQFAKVSGATKRSKIHEISTHNFLIDFYYIKKSDNLFVLDD